MIPNIKEAQKQSRGVPKAVLMCCVKCKKPLWRVSDFVRYGTRWGATKEPFPGVGSYDEYWAKDQKTALKVDCPFCGKHYFDVLVAGEVKIPKVYHVEEY